LGDEVTSRLQIKIALEQDLAASPLTILCSARREIIPALECAVKDAQIGVQAGRILERLRRLDERLPEIRRSLRRHASAIALRQPRIAIQAFGAMQVAVDGRKISGQAWKSQQQRDLLFYLLQHNKGASKERMDRDIWGSVEENSARLRNALYKIRQSLGLDVIIYQDGLYFFNPALDYEYDVENFRYHLAQARAENADHMGCRALQRVVDLYQGDYAVGAEGHWVVAERERLYQEYLWAVASLVERIMGQGQYTNCRNVCLRAIELDPQQEEFYRLAMRVADAEGDHGGVHHFYQLCRRALDKPKVAEPSDQTYRLYKQLTT
jgi:two-component SAPR family response regulator